MPTSNVVPGYPAISFVPTPQVGIGSDGPYYTPPSNVAGAASGTVTMGGTPATSNTVTTTINGHGVLYTLTGGDTTTTLVATHVAAAINADSTSNQIVTASSTGPVVTITAKVNGLTGQYSLSTTVTGGGVTATASDTELDFSNGWYIAKTTFNWLLSSDMPKTYYKGAAYQIDPINAAQMRALGYIG